MHVTLTRTDSQRVAIPWNQIATVLECVYSEDLSVQENSKIAAYGQQITVKETFDEVLELIEKARKETL